MQLAYGSNCEIVVWGDCFYFLQGSFEHQQKQYGRGHFIRYTWVITNSASANHSSANQCIQVSGHDKSNLKLIKNGEESYFDRCMLVGIRIICLNITDSSDLEWDRNRKYPVNSSCLG